MPRTPLRTTLSPVFCTLFAQFTVIAATKALHSQFQMMFFSFLQQKSCSPSGSTKSIATRGSSECDELSVQYTMKAQPEVLSDTIPATSVAPSTSWTSIYIASFLSVCSGVQQSLYFSSLWPYLQVVSLLQWPLMES